MVVIQHPSSAPIHSLLRARLGNLNLDSATHQPLVKSKVGLRWVKPWMRAAPDDPIRLQERALRIDSFNPEVVNATHLHRWAIVALFATAFLVAAWRWLRPGFETRSVQEEWCMIGMSADTSPYSLSERYKAAGLVAYVWGPHGPLFLFVREPVYIGNSAIGYADLGGKREDGEGPQDTAAREFYEELRGEETSNPQQVRDLAWQLRKWGRSLYNPRSKHVLFILELPEKPLIQSDLVRWVGADAVLRVLADHRNLHIRLRGHSTKLAKEIQRVVREGSWYYKP